MLPGDIGREEDHCRAGDDGYHEERARDHPEEFVFLQKRNLFVPTEEVQPRGDVEKPLDHPEYGHPCGDNSKGR